MAEEMGNSVAAARLRGDGPEAYPGLDDLPYVARVVGGTVIAQVKHCQVAYGEGPVIMQVHATVVEDPQGRKAPHWELLQSWIPKPSTSNADNASTPFGTTALPSTTDAQMVARRDIPGAATSANDFCELLGLLNTSMRTDLLLQPDPPSTYLSVIERVAHLEREVSKPLHGRPAWPRELQHLAVGLLVTYRWRLSDVFMREHVEMLHMILGRGERLLVAHERQPYFWNNTVGCWNQYEGLLPEYIFSHMKDYLLRLEGLYRSINPKTERDVPDLSKAIDDAFQQCGRSCTTAATTWLDAARFCREHDVQGHSEPHAGEAPHALQASPHRHLGVAHRECELTPRHNAAVDIGGGDGYAPRRPQEGPLGDLDGQGYLADRAELGDEALE